MTDVSEADVAPQTNGFREDGLEEDDRMKMRPADIDADMREMERRKRVEMIMSSRLFREELERIIEAQMKDGNGPAGLLQQISDMMGIQGGRLQSTNFFKSSNCVVPINDIRGVESMGYAKGEKILRCKLAAVYRLIDLYGWTQSIHNHITARLNQDQEHFLVNAFGMLYHEITASSLVKVDMQGAVVEQGTTNFGVNVPGFQLHAAVHAARPDIKCIIHLHTPSVLAVSSLKCGLLPLCQESIVIGEVSQHQYLGSISEPEEKEKLARDLGPINKIMFLTNHGVMCCGETVEEAFYNVYNTVLACETQLKLMPVGIENLQLIPDEIRKQIYDSARNTPEGTAPPPSQIDKKEKRFRIGGMEFEALMRMLDNAGFRTGYIYRQPLVKGDPPRPRNDVEVPPAVSSLGYLLEEEEMYKHGNWKKYADGRKSNDRTRWLNSPNVYQKVEILETGTPDPKKITKWVDANSGEWVAEGSPQHSSTPVKIEHALQFVPKNTNPKEFKKLQQQIKENRRADKITSGPQSHILEGVSWEEAKKLQDANISQTGDQVILVGAASKGIIQRGFQHNATVYKTPYAKNPFDAVSDQELEDYKRVVTRKQRGESSYDEDQSESEALSSSAALPPGIKSPASETEEESRDEPRVLRIETKQVPRPSQAEVVLSDEGESLENDISPALMQRSKSSRYPEKEQINQLNRSNSLGRNHQVKKDGCGIGNGSLSKEGVWSSQGNPTPCQSLPQAIKVSAKYTILPSQCQVMPMLSADEHDSCYKLVKDKYCDLLYSELEKNNDYLDASNLSSNMTRLVLDFKRKLSKMRMAKKKFFEDYSRKSCKTNFNVTTNEFGQKEDLNKNEKFFAKYMLVDKVESAQFVMLNNNESRGDIQERTDLSKSNFNRLSSCVSESKNKEGVILLSNEINNAACNSFPDRQPAVKYVQSPSCETSDKISNEINKAEINAKRSIETENQTDGNTSEAIQILSSDLDNGESFDKYLGAYSNTLVDIYSSPDVKINEDMQSVLQVSENQEKFVKTDCLLDTFIGNNNNKTCIMLEEEMKSSIECIKEINTIEHNFEEDLEWFNFENIHTTDIEEKARIDHTLSNTVVHVKINDKGTLELFQFDSTSQNDTDLENKYTLSTVSLINEKSVEDAQSLSGLEEEIEESIEPLEYKNYYDTVDILKECDNFNVGEQTIVESTHLSGLTSIGERNNKREKSFKKTNNCEEITPLKSDINELLKGEENFPHSAKEVSHGEKDNNMMIVGDRYLNENQQVKHLTGYSITLESALYESTNNMSLYEEKLLPNEGHFEIVAESLNEQETGEMKQISLTVDSAEHSEGMETLLPDELLVNNEDLEYGRIEECEVFQTNVATVESVESLQILSNNNNGYQSVNVTDPEKVKQIRLTVDSAQYIEAMETSLPYELLVNNNEDLECGGIEEYEKYQTYFAAFESVDSFRILSNNGKGGQNLNEKDSGKVMQRSLTVESLENIEAMETVLPDEFLLNNEDLEYGGIEESEQFPRNIMTFESVDSLKIIRNNANECQTVLNQRTDYSSLKTNKRNYLSSSNHSEYKQLTFDPEVNVSNFNENERGIFEEDCYVKRKGDFIEELEQFCFTEKKENCYVELEEAHCNEKKECCVELEEANYTEKEEDCYVELEAPCSTGKGENRYIVLEEACSTEREEDSYVELDKACSTERGEDHYVNLEEAYSFEIEENCYVELEETHCTENKEFCVELEEACSNEREEDHYVEHEKASYTEKNKYCVKLEEACSTKREEDCIAELKKTCSTERGEDRYVELEEACFTERGEDNFVALEEACSTNREKDRYVEREEDRSVELEEGCSTEIVEDCYVELEVACSPEKKEYCVVLEEACFTKRGENHNVELEEACSTEREEDRYVELEKACSTERGEDRYVVRAEAFSTDREKERYVELEEGCSTKIEEYHCVEREEACFVELEEACFVELEEACTEIEKDHSIQLEKASSEREENHYVVLAEVCSTDRREDCYVELEEARSTDREEDRYVELEEACSTDKGEDRFVKQEIACSTEREEDLYVELEKACSTEIRDDRFVDLEEACSTDRGEDHFVEWEEACSTEREEDRYVELEKACSSERGEDRFVELEEACSTDRGEDRFVEWEEACSAEREEDRYVELEKACSSERGENRFVELEEACSTEGGEDRYVELEEACIEREDHYVELEKAGNEKKEYFIELEEACSSNREKNPFDKMRGRCSVKNNEGCIVELEESYCTERKDSFIETEGNMYIVKHVTKGKKVKDLYDPLSYERQEESQLVEESGFQSEEATMEEIESFIEAVENHINSEPDNVFFYNDLNKDETSDDEVYTFSGEFEIVEDLDSIPSSSLYDSCLLSSDNVNFDTCPSNESLSNYENCSEINNFETFCGVAQNTTDNIFYKQVGSKEQDEQCNDCTEFEMNNSTTMINNYEQQVIEDCKTSPTNRLFKVNEPNCNDSEIVGNLIMELIFEKMIRLAEEKYPYSFGPLFCDDNKTTRNQNSEPNTTNSVLDLALSKTDLLNDDNKAFENVEGSNIVFSVKTAKCLSIREDQPINLNDEDNCLKKMVYESIPFTNKQIEIQKISPEKEKYLDILNQFEDMLAQDMQSEDIISENVVESPTYYSLDDSPKFSHDNSLSEREELRVDTSSLKIDKNIVHKNKSVHHFDNFTENINELDYEYRSEEACTNNDSIYPTFSNKPLSRVGSSLSFHTVSVESIPSCSRQVSPSPSNSFSSDENDNLKIFDEINSNVVRDCDLSLSNLADNVPNYESGGGCTINNYVGDEYQLEFDTSATSIVGNDRDPYYDIAERMLTPSPKSESDSLNYQVIFPINKPTYEYSGTSEESIGDITCDSIEVSALCLDGKSESKPKTPLRFDIEKKMPTFLVVDFGNRKTPSKLQQNRNVEYHSKQDVSNSRSVDTRLSEASESKNKSFLHMKTFRNSDNNFSTPERMNSLSVNKTLFNELNYVSSPKLSLNSPYQVHMFDSAPHSSPLDKEMDDLSFCENNSNSMEIGISETDKTTNGSEVDNRASCNIKPSFFTDTANSECKSFVSLEDILQSNSSGFKKSPECQNSSLSGYEADVEIDQSSTFVGSKLAVSFPSQIDVTSDDCCLTVNTNEIEGIIDLEEQVIFVEEYKGENSVCEICSNDLHVEQDNKSKNVSNDYDPLGELSYISATSVDDEITDVSYTDSLLSGGEEASDTNHRDIQANIHFKTRCCQYSPLATKNPSLLPPIIEDEDST